MTVPNPGSDEAVKAGCCCPILDNCRGLGIGKNGKEFGWWKNANCPIHGRTEPSDDCAEADNAAAEVERGEGL